MSESTQKPAVTLVNCPEPFEPLFAAAEQIIGSFFTGLVQRPAQAELEISGERYILMRAESIGVELFRELKKSFGEAGARQVTYKIGHACGRRDAEMFHARLGVDDPVMKLALGPVHFAHVGWARVDIFPESAPSPDDNYLLVYDHPNSFEADAYLKSGEMSKFPACHMNAGYSAGWCSESFGVDVKAQEICCRAAGDAQCIFVMAPPKRLAERIDEFKKLRGM